MKSKNVKYFLAYMVLLVFASSPIWLTSRPQLGDYTNHLARVHILLNVSNSPTLQQFYLPQWALIPNLAMDLVVAGLATIMSLETAGKTFITLTLMLLSSGTIALHTALHKCLSAWPLIVFLILYNFMFLMGSMNFLFGLGMALWMLAAWIFLRRHPHWLRILIFCPLAVALYFAHLSAFGVYLLALLGYEFAHYRVQRAEGFHVSPFTCIPTLMQLVIPALLFLASPTAGGYEQYEYYLLNKLITPFFLVLNYSLLLDGLTFVFIAEIITLGLITKRLTINKAMYWALGAVTFAYLAMPSLFFSSSLADSRIFVGLALLFVAGSDMRLRTAAEARMLMLSLLGTFVLRIAFINDHWQAANHLQNEYFHAFDKLPQGAKLLTLIGDKDKWKNKYDFWTMWNFPCWAIIKKSAFVPTLYTFPTQQPVSYTLPYREIANQTADWRFQNMMAQPPHIFNNFDYILIERTHPAFILPSQPSLHLIDSSDNFRLFKIVISQGVP